jgi:multiple sugar transport system substrate-binding protein
VAFIANTGSVGIAAQSDDPELFEATRFSALPAGPEGVISPIQPQLRAVPASSENPEAAEALIEHLSQPEFTERYFAAAIYGPVLQAQATFPVFTGASEIHAGLVDLVENGTAPGFPDVYNPAYTETYNNFIVPRMAQRVVVDGWDADRAIAEAQAAAAAIYAKYE